MGGERERVSVGLLTAEEGRYRYQSVPDHNNVPKKLVPDHNVPNKKNVFFQKWGGAVPS